MGVGGVDAGQDERLDALMAAVVSMSTELDVGTVLQRLVAAGCRLTGARYGALGVLGPHGDLQQFVHLGMDAGTVERIGHLPSGRGVLGHLMSSPHVLRLHDLTAHPSSVGFPPHHPPMHTFLGVPVRARGGVFGNLYLTDKAGDADFTARDEQIAVALAAAAGVAVDHARVFHRTRQHELWLETAAACTATLTSGVPRDEAVAAVLARVRRSAGAPVAHLYRDDNMPEALSGDLTGRGPVLREVPAGSLPGWGPAAWVLALPLRSGDRWLGALALFWPAHRETTPHVDLPSVAGFGEQVALALDVADAQSDRARLAVLEERERIARDLHDMVIQRLFAIGLDVQGAAQDAVRPDVADRLEHAVGELDETIKDIRSTIFRLGSRGGSPGTGLRHRIDAEVVGARRVLGFLPRLRTDGITATVPDAVGEDAVAVVREALANVARHARAHEVVVRIDVGRDLLVEVQDDGVGMPDAATPSGLTNLEDRAVRRGGTLQLVAPPGGGTLLRWSVPLT
ncbi:GAF domain-containing sensor histidine kinase [Cellulomonas sp.]|uniref:GAF domain-containing sensor histidine kinase n=1 Tax=Cellulomonas sp. TaxID=40001 RepID=UPI001B1AFB69|nr:GAF domain-containing sensor histidine kinase [Cellulomonas sp.]MBO9555056.1 GAF domain-containing sensor histidine kinase [Cellulomonas sp.]